jgi:hypothetical protein
LKKLLVITILTLTTLGFFACTAFAAPAVSIFVDGKQVISDVAPQIIQSRTMVPIRFVAEALGARVEWVAEERMVTIDKDQTSIKLYIDKKDASKNGQDISLDVPATIVNSRTLVPIRFISENLGCKVDWDPKEYKVIITSEQVQTDSSPSISAPSNSEQKASEPQIVGSNQQPTGSWLVESSFEGSVTKDFSLKIANLNNVEFYELYANGKQVGNRVNIGKSLRSAGIIFSEPSKLSIKFYTTESSTTPAATATLNSNGTLSLTVPGT